MTSIGWLQIIIFMTLLIIISKPLGAYMAIIYNGKSNKLCKIIEDFIYKTAAINPTATMNWKQYLIAMLYFNLLGIIIVYVVQRLQFYLPLNLQHFFAQSPELSFNTAISFATNTNWQAYSGEHSISYFTQVIALCVQNFTSAATGMSLSIALIRGISQHENSNLGNFWIDATRSILYILLPLSIILAIFLSSQGVIQNFKPYQQIQLLDKSQLHAIQIIPMGPVASQVAISQLGSNGGSFFNTNASHPFANPNPLTNFFEMLAICLIPASFFYTFGLIIKDTRQSTAMLKAIFIILLPCLVITILSEQNLSPMMKKTIIDTHQQYKLYSAGNMEGKETRFGIINSAMWATLSTATSNGSMNTMIDSFNPLGSLMPLWLMQLGETIFGGVGSGTTNMLIITFITIFITGLMVGRTPEYLGKKIESFEIKMASIAILIMPITVLIITAIAIMTTSTSSLINMGAHGFTTILYACTSLSNNNGSMFAGLNVNTWFYNIIGGLIMLINRYWTAIAILALAGSLAQKKITPNNYGTLETHTPLFITLLISILILIGALAFLPALALGPIVEQLTLWKQYG